MKKFFSGGWKAQDLLRREDVLQILTTNLRVFKHAPPDGMEGCLFCVDGVAACCDAVMDLLEVRAKARKEKNGTSNNNSRKRPGK